MGNIQRAAGLKFRRFRARSGRPAHQLAAPKQLKLWSQRVFWVYGPVKIQVTCCTNLRLTNSWRGSISTSPSGRHMPPSSHTRVWRDEGHPALRPSRSVVLSGLKKFSCAKLTSDGPLCEAQQPFYGLKRIVKSSTLRIHCFMFLRTDAHTETLSERTFLLFRNWLTESLFELPSIPRSGWVTVSMSSTWYEIKWDEYTKQTITWSPMDIS